MNETDKQKFHDISAKMAEESLATISEPLGEKISGHQKKWLELYDELCMVGKEKR